MVIEVARHRTVCERASPRQRAYRVRPASLKRVLHALPPLLSASAVFICVESPDGMHTSWHVRARLVRPLTPHSWSSISNRSAGNCEMSVVCTNNSGVAVTRVAGAAVTAAAGWDPGLTQ